MGKGKSYRYVLIGKKAELERFVELYDDLLVKLDSYDEKFYLLNNWIGDDWSLLFWMHSDVMKDVAKKLGLKRSKLSRHGQSVWEVRG